MSGEDDVASGGSAYKNATRDTPALANADEANGGLAAGEGGEIV